MFLYTAESLLRFKWHSDFHFPAIFVTNPNITILNIFGIVVDEVGVGAGKAVHVGDDQKADKEGANAVGIDCW